MTPEERAAAVANQTHRHPEECGRALRGPCPLYREALAQLRAAIAEERKACARAICLECADGWPFDDEGNHRAPAGEGHWLPVAHCLAGPILARASDCGQATPQE